jgi:protocatechuate 3,4-dioxygenase, alpha subunit
MSMSATTPSQTIGPFFHISMVFARPAAFGDSTEGTLLEGRVIDGEGAGVSDAMVELWDGQHLARCCSDEMGAFAFAVRTDAVTRATPDGEAPHLAVSVFARGLLARLATRCYLPADADRLAADRFLASVPAERRDTLIAQRVGQGLRFDIHLQGAQETVFYEW